MSYNKDMKNKFKIGLGMAATIPPITSTYGLSAFGGVRNWITGIGNLIEIAIPIVVALAILAFFWGLIKFIRSVSETGKSEGKTFMIWGIVALFVMISVWGLVKFIGDQVGITQGQVPQLPQVPKNY